jgi:hypothetical protein
MESVTPLSVGHSGAAVRVLAGTRVVVRGVTGAGAVGTKAGTSGAAAVSCSGVVGSGVGMPDAVSVGRGRAAAVAVDFGVDFNSWTERVVFEVGDDVADTVTTLLIMMPAAITPKTTRTADTIRKMRTSLRGESPFTAPV